MSFVTIAITVAVSIGGLVLGFLLGLNGFSQPATGGAFNQSPRVKNLAWLFSAGILIFVADFKKLNLPDTFPWVWPFAGYEIAAFVGAGIAVASMLISITKSVATFNATRPAELRLDPRIFEREYLTFGKGRYEELWEKERKRSDEAVAQARADEIKRSQDVEKARQEKEARRHLEVVADKIAASCVHAVLRHLAMDEQARSKAEGALIETLMEAAVSLVQAHSPAELTLRGSYMAFQSVAKADAATANGSRFTDEMPPEYIGYLILRRGGGMPAREIVLPVAKNEEAILPGAPEAVKKLGPAIMNFGEIGFRPRVSEKVRGEIRKYFKEGYFDNIKSVSSLPITDGHKIHGVLNIESSADNLLGVDREAAEAVFARLQTLVALLSVFQ
jgi:hypothetical protein